MELYKFKPGIRNDRVPLNIYADFMHDIVQAVREPLLVLDSSLRVKIANKSFYKIFRVNPAETENQLIYELGNGQWKILKLLELLKMVLVDKVGFEDYEMEHSFPDIGAKNMLLDASLIYHEIESTETILLAIEEVTEQRAAGKKLKQLNTDLENRGRELERSGEEIKRLSKLKADFTARVSHELRAPLTAIKESVSIVSKGVVRNHKEQESFLEMALRNIDRLTRLVDNILDFSKLDSGKQRLRMVKGDINELIREAGAFYEPLAVRKGLRIRFELQAGIPAMNFDYDSILQVLTNLLSNAVKFTRHGEIVVRTKLRSVWVDIFVRDTGVGIERKDIKRLFQPFEQIESPEGGKSEGSGLGLTISRQIVEQHKGKIAIRSSIGRGTLVRFNLPLDLNEMTTRELILVH